MTFKKTAEGRVFFQGSNNNDAPQSDNPSIDNLPKSADQNQSQLQVLSLLRSLNNRLQDTQEERDQFRKDIESYKDLVRELSDRTIRSDKILTDLGQKLEVQETESLKKIKKAESQAGEAFKELSETRKLLSDIEEKSARTEQKLRTQISQRGQLDEAIKAEYESIKLAQEAQREELNIRLQVAEDKQKQLIALQSKQTSLNVDEIKDQAEKLLNQKLAERESDIEDKIRRAADLGQSLDQKIEDAMNKNAQLDRKLEKALQDRTRMIRKIERLEETVIQTHDALNAKALVLLTDRNIAEQSGLPSISAEPEVKADAGSIVPAKPAVQEQQAHQLEQEEEPYSPVWKRSKNIQIAAIVALFILGLLGGWAISQIKNVEFSNAQEFGLEDNQRGDQRDEDYADPSENVSGADLESSALRLADPLSETGSNVIEIDRGLETVEIDDPFYSRQTVSEDGVSNDEAAQAKDAENSLGLTQDEQEMLDLMQKDPDALAEQLNAIEPSIQKKAEEFAEEIQVAGLQPSDNAEPIVQPSSQPVSQRIKPDKKLPENVKAIEQKAFEGVPAAQHDLAAIYTAGHVGVKQDYKRAAQWFREAADNGVANARYNLGVLYHQGIGVDKDVQQAIQWYQSAADLDHPEAQYNLGIAYVEGIGVGYDPKRADTFFKKAAGHGIMEAAYNLGLIYENGLLGESKPDQALAWYKKAADQGSPEAKTALEQLADNLDMDVNEINKVVSDIKLENMPATEPTGSYNYTEEFNKRITERIQKQLSDLGLYKGPADGISGKKTQEAIRSYQASNNLTVDGRPSKNLLNHMIINADG